MHSDNTGKTIREIIFQKKQVVVHFEDDTSITLSKEVYSDFYLYPKKVISEEEYETIKLRLLHMPFEQYALRLLSKARYSEFQIREKLYRREATKPIVDAVIQRMQTMHLIDDDTLLQDWLTHYQAKKLGQLEIKQQLYHRGLNKTRVENIVFHEEEELQKSKYWVAAFAHRNHAVAEKALKQKLYQLLVRKGFQSDVISEALKLMILPDAQLVYSGLKKDLLRAHQRYHKKFQQRALQTKLINFLLTKGYTYKDIIKALVEEKL